ncbi:MAG: hypothetical protein ACRDF4_05610 [Rhabdochlamydiaceae bacterium]
MKIDEAYQQGDTPNEFSFVAAKGESLQWGLFRNSRYMVIVS